MTYDNLDAYKESLATERRALDEENFEEAAQQAFRVASPSEVSRAVYEIQGFDSYHLIPLDSGFDQSLVRFFSVHGHLVIGKSLMSSSGPYSRPVTVSKFLASSPCLATVHLSAGIGRTSPNLGCTPRHESFHKGLRPIAKSVQGQGESGLASIRRMPQADAAICRIG